ncbi:stalk domain-containing protein [Paenibacillus sp. SC116]|uniref:stalk domain-containing protein n=1 Tax=Paenibacillus sp. SC116 TaxID=2968986 RepID=UPI00215B3805|nr:stalk domain-containing protein [Paenibacillus sp. SC116]MCR8842724.1 stalk domain-containing protein [Paenibacillus sp. SC116]
MRRKSWLASLVTIIMLCTFALDSRVAAANPSQSASIIVHENNVLEWNKRFTFLIGNDSYISKDKMLYVTHHIANEAIPMRLTYDVSSKTLMQDLENQQLEMIVGSKTISLNGKSISVKHPVISHKGNVYVSMEILEKIVNAKTKYVSHTSSFVTDKIAIDNSMKQTMKQRESNLNKATREYEASLEKLQAAIDENRYDIAGELRHGFKQTTVWGTATSRSSRREGHLSDSNNIVITNPDKSNMTGDRYYGEHYFIKKGTGYGLYNQKVGIFYFGPPSKAIQNNIAARKKVVAKAEANVRARQKELKNSADHWVSSILKHYNAKGGTKKPEVLAQMVMHFDQLHHSTGMNIFKANKDKWNKQLLQTSQYNYWLLDYVLEQEDKGKFNKRFNYLLSKNKAAALTTIYTPEDFAAAAQKLYEVKMYPEALSAASIAKANGVDTEKLIYKIHGVWIDPYEKVWHDLKEGGYEEFLEGEKQRELEAKQQQEAEKRLQDEKEKEHTALEKWKSDYHVLLTKFNNEFHSKYGNLEYVNGLSSDQRRALSQDIVAYYKLPLFDLEAGLKVFKHVELDAVKENIGNMKSAIEQLSTLGDEERTRIAAAHLDLAMFTAGLIE